MANGVPSSLSLSVINNGDPVSAAPHRNNYAAIQTAINALEDCFSGGTLGQVLEAVDGSDVQWGIPHGTILGYGRQAADKTCASGLFSGGTDILASAITFTADGTSDYEVSIASYYITGNTNGAAVEYYVNLDGAQGVAFGLVDIPTANQRHPGTAAVELVAPAAGSHTVNVRLVNGGAGGTVTVAAPTLVKVSKL